MRRWARPLPLPLPSVRAVVPVAVAALLALVAGAAPALAAGGGHEEPRLDSIDPLSIGMALGVFALLLVVLTKFAWGPILKGLKAREASIQKAVDDAQAASAKAEAVMREYETKLARANDEGRAILEEARRDGLALKASIEADAKRAADESTARAVREIEQARAAAWDALVRDAARLSTEAASRIIRRSLDAEGHAALVDEVVSEVVAARRGARG